MTAATTTRPRRHPSIFAPPWRTPAGRFSWLKTVTLALCVAPAPFILWQWDTGDLGGRPVHHAMLETGFWAIRFLILCLAVTPARSLFDWPRVMMLRRMLGLTAAFYTFAHIILYAADEGFAAGFVLGQMVTVFYLILGTIATIGFIALSLTSTDAAIARLGRNWKSLHRLIYPIAALSLWHFFLTQKIDIGIAMVPAGLFVWLMLWRATPHAFRRSLAGLIALAVGAVAITAFGEAGWYVLNSGIDPWRVLAANLSTARPTAAMFVAADLAFLIVIVAARRTQQRLARS
ncbi:sulfoxide reductase heme-binding subunit YedZ [Acidiphilium sp. AL]|uniref:sulfite oxidase heme-binding subunit YedZ n=1 Tax=Acidiphilium sp. AL TaxID=2871704 RepID=UPI0021CB5CF6|nr:protein-methionine-sulfoxide reductase heme-binding subunit MsrQ [Acidiphilium sp. AL]MCU4158679.1 sulfoxide reductase heme-binding subunit YedZ [Acidiphilium sp. AL]